MLRRYQQASIFECGGCWRHDSYYVVLPSSFLASTSEKGSHLGTRFVRRCL